AVMLMVFGSDFDLVILPVLGPHFPVRGANIRRHEFVIHSRFVLPAVSRRNHRAMSDWRAPLSSKALKTTVALPRVAGMKRSLVWLQALTAFWLGISRIVAAEGYTIPVIPKGTTHEFWKSINAGAVKAQRELNEKGIKIDVIWKGPLREDDRDQQIQVIENFISRRVSGIVLAPLDSKALVRPVATAMRAKIPVVIMDSGLKSDTYVSFVATDNFKGGQLAAEHLGKLLGGKGKVILLRYAVGSA